MENSKAGSSKVGLLVVLLIVIAGAYYFFQHTGTLPVNNSTESKTSRSVASPSVSEISSVIYRRDSDQNEKTAAELYVTDLENKNPINLTKKLGLSSYQSIVKNQSLSKIAYAVKSDAAISIFKANSDGSEVKKYLKLIIPVVMTWR